MNCLQVVFGKGLVRKVFQVERHHQIGTSLDSGCHDMTVLSIRQ